MSIWNEKVEYLDGYQYNDNFLEFFPHAEGYVKATNLSLGNNPNYVFNYVYNYTDHLGNVRLSYAKDPQSGNLKILDESHYYPFGLKHQEYSTFGFVSNPIQGVIIAPLTNNPYQYKYNGKEWQDELNFNMYDMDMRQYDPAIARWVVLDPVIHHSLSPYSAFDNNPVFWADPSGADSEFFSAFADQNIDHYGTSNTIDIANIIEANQKMENTMQMIKALIKLAENYGGKNSKSGGEPNNGDPKKKKKNQNENDSSKGNKGATIAGSTYSALGEHGEKKLKSGEYTQTNGKTGNFNDRPYNKLSDNAKAHFDSAKGLSKLKLLGMMGNLYSFGDGVWKDYNSFANGEPSIENTAVASGGIIGGIIGGFGLGFILGLETGPGAIITGIIGGVAGGIIGEEAVKSFFR